MLARVTVIWGLGWRWKITFQDVVTVQLLSHVWHSATPETTTCQSSLSFTDLLNSCSWNLLKLMFIESVNQPSHPLSSPSPPAFNLSQNLGFFQWVSSSHQVAKVLELQLQHQPSNEYSGLISFKTGWFDLLAVQRTLKRLLQYHSLKASILWLSAFFMVPLSHPYMTIGNIALTVQTFPRWLIHMTGK